MPKVLNEKKSKAVPQFRLLPIFARLGGKKENVLPFRIKVKGEKRDCRFRIPNEYKIDLLRV